MRRSLLVTAAAAISMVLLAMLVPMAILVRSYALEDRLARAALEVQAVETVVSRPGRQGSVGAVRRPAQRRRRPHPGHRALPRRHRRRSRPGRGRARPRCPQHRPRPGRRRAPAGRRSSSRSPAAATPRLPSQTPVIRVVVDEPGLDSVVGRRLGPARPARPWSCSPARWSWSTGSVARSCSRSAQLAEHTAVAGQLRHHRARRRARRARRRCRSSPAPSTASSVGSSCCWRASARTSPTSPTASARPSPRCGCGSRPSSDADLRERLSGDLDSLQATVDEIVREARRSEREGLDPRTDAVAVLAERVRHWEPLAEDQGRTYDDRPRDLRPAAARQPRRPRGAGRRAAGQRLLPHARRRRRTHHADRHRRPRRPGRRGRRPRAAGRTRRRPVAARAVPARPGWASRSPPAPPQDSGGEVTTGASDMGGARVAVTLRTA